MQSSDRIRVLSNTELNEITSFSDIGLKDELLQLLLESEIKVKPVLQHCLDYMLKQKSILIISPPGLGRSLCSMIGLLNNVDPSLPYTQALVLSPTGSLAQEYSKDFKSLNKTIKLSTLTCIAKVFIDPKSLKSQVIIGTCGRILRFIREKKIELTHLKYIVCDIADNLFEHPVIDDTEDLLNFINKPCVYWYLSPTNRNFIKEKLNSRVGEFGTFEIITNELVIEKMKFYVKIVNNDQEENDFIKRLVHHRKNPVILFSHNAEQLKTYEKILENYSASLISKKYSKRQQDSILQDFEMEVIKVLICESKGYFIRRINAKNKVDIVFLDPSKKVNTFLLRLRRKNFHEDDEVFFVIRQHHYPVIQEYVANLNLVVEHF